MNKKKTYTCGHDDCFTCPYPDCISNNVNDGALEDLITVPVKLRKEKGICVVCGKRPAEQGLQKCEECKEFYNLQKRISYHEQRKRAKETNAQRDVANNRELMQKIKSKMEGTEAPIVAPDRQIDTEGLDTLEIAVKLVTSGRYKQSIFKYNGLTEIIDALVERNRKKAESPHCVKWEQELIGRGECPSCTAEVTNEMKYCYSCGQRLIWFKPEVEDEC